MTPGGPVRIGVAGDGRGGWRLRPPAAGCCATSAATWPTRLLSCSARPRRCTPKCTRGGRARGPGRRPGQRRPRRGRTAQPSWITSTSATGASGPACARATLRQPHARNACCAAAAPGSTVSVARSSGRPSRIRSCRSRPMPCRRQDARTSRSTSAKVRPGRSAVTSFRQRRGQLPPPRRGRPQRHPGRVSDQVAAVAGLGKDEPGLPPLDGEPAPVPLVVLLVRRVGIHLGVQPVELFRVRGRLPAVEQLVGEAGSGHG